MHAFATEGAHCTKVRELLNNSDVSLNSNLTWLFELLALASWHFRCGFCFCLHPVASILSISKFSPSTTAFQVWSAYKDQRHDLFLPSNAQSAAAGIAGLIENSSSSRLIYALTAPPQSTTSRTPPSSSPDFNGKQDQPL